jgi:hypothetical protein
MGDVGVVGTGYVEVVVVVVVDEEEVGDVGVKEDVAKGRYQ